MRTAPSVEALKHLQTTCNRYEPKLREHLQGLKICFMRDLLAFLEQDALSIDAIKEKILANGYDKNAFDYKARRDVYFCIHNLTHWSFDEIMRTRNGDKEADPQSVLYISNKTLKIFTEADDLFRQFARDCNDGDDGTGTILRNGIHDWYANEKSSQFGFSFEHVWSLAANASGGWWSTMLYGITVPHSMQFSLERMQEFIRFRAEEFNACIDKIIPTKDAESLKQNLKKQFRDNCFEYILRGIYSARPFPEKDDWIGAILRYAETFPSTRNTPLSGFSQISGTKPASY